jgi:hypothetical protein
MQTLHVPSRLVEPLDDGTSLGEAVRRYCVVLIVANDNYDFHLSRSPIVQSSLRCELDSHARYL